MHDCFSPPCLRQLSRFRSGALATVAGGSLDPSDLSQRLSSLPPEAESEGDSAPLFGGGRSFTCIHVHTLYMYIVYRDEKEERKKQAR